jgi:hypothetical protein
MIAPRGPINLAAAEGPPPAAADGGAHAQIIRSLETRHRRRRLLIVIELSLSAHCTPVAFMSVCRSEFYERRACIVQRKVSHQGVVALVHSKCTHSTSGGSARLRRGCLGVSANGVSSSMQCDSRLQVSGSSLHIILWGAQCIGGLICMLPCHEF